MAQYTTTAQVQAELSTTESFSTATVPTEAQVTTWIGEVSDYIDTLSGVTQGTSDYTEVIDYNGDDDRIQLKNVPVNTVTSFQYSTVALSSTDYPAWDTQTANTDYALYGDRGELFLIKENFKPKAGERRFQVVYNAGNQTLPPRIQMLATKMVTKRVLDTILSKDVKEKQSGKSISVGSISIVKPAQFGVNQYQALGSEIEQIKSELLKGSGVYRYNNY